MSVLLKIRQQIKKGLLFGGLFLWLSPNIVFAQNQASTELVSIIGVGDMMMGTNYPSSSYLPPNNGNNLLDDVRDMLKNADVTFGNLEGAILDSGGKAKTCSNPDVCYVFRSPETYGKHFEEAGFDFLSIANNHSGDFGGEGRSKTKSVLRKHNIKYAGLAGTDEQAIFEQNGIKYGLAAFAPNSGTCDIRNLAKAKAIVADLATKVDIVIVSFHGGAEGPDAQHVPKTTETYYGENRGNVYAFAHAVVDAGADVVFGHGPHVTRGFECYNDRFIAYSLGNFCTYGRFNLNGAAGIAPMVKIFCNKDGSFVHGEVTSIYQKKSHGPKIDPNQAALKKIIALTKEDFNGGGLFFSKEGHFAPQP